jgi:hypothetical protein
MTERPDSLAAVAAASSTLEDFGRHLRDWLHHVRTCTTRAKVGAAIAEPPPLLAARFAEGAVADAWLAAYGELAARRARVPVPAWAGRPERVSAQPWFADTTGSEALRWLALRDSPLPFKRRNLYLPAAEAELPLRLRRGRPRKPAHERRLANAARQRRFRMRRAEELASLRQLVAGAGRGGAARRRAACVVAGRR